MQVDLSPSHLAEFLRSRRDLILKRWQEAVQDRPASQGLSRRALIDHLPQLLDAIAETGELNVTDQRARIDTETAERHALERLSEGFDLSQVVVELAVLRDCILEAWDEERAPGAARPEVRFLNRSVDRAVGASVDQYVRARDRTLKALDRISTVALESRRLDDLLYGLLKVMADTTASVDTAAILLREGDDLVLRAAVGLEESHAGSFRLRIGEGFAGRVAAAGQPRLVSGAQLEAEGIVSPALEGKKLRCLYGVPLKDGDGVIGVARIGSLSAPEFSEQDRRLFDALAVRASSGIVQHLLREATERRAAELDAVIESIPDAAFIGDERGIRRVNRAALELLGVGSVEEVNRSADALVAFLRARHAETGVPLSPAERPFVRALRGESGNTDIAMRHGTTGREIILRCAAAPILSGERVAGGIVVCSDITDRKRQTEELQRLYREAQRAAADRQHILAIVSHDLRNPLNVVNAAATLLGEAALQPEQAGKTLDSIRRAVVRMNRMIADLLDLSSIEAGRLAIDARPLDPRSVIEDAAEMFSVAAERRGIALRTDVSGHPPLVHGDHDRLVQALSNLATNALSVTEEGSLTLQLAEADRAVRFGVIDTGPGIPEAVQSRIFDPYWRADSSTYKGTGLGLAIARGIVEAHRGRIWVESRPGEGAAFYFTVPVA
jgi:PAS domain S-box-containing protein